MSKGYSGLFKNTVGFMFSLFEDAFDRIISANGNNIDFKRLPGEKGFRIRKRLTDNQMELLTRKYGVEFAQVYILGKGINGRGGKYYLYSGTKNSVLVPVSKNTILINHTHPGGTAYPSKQDLKLLELYSQQGSPQKTSSIIPVGKKTIKFTSKGGL